MAHDFTRRGILVAGLAATALGLGARPAAASGDHDRAHRHRDRHRPPADSAGSTGPSTAERAAASAAGLRFLDLMMDAYPGTYTLPQSFSDQVNLADTAFTYDAAMAVLAYLGTGGGAGTARAARLGDALLYAQQHDPGYADGRLRQAYGLAPDAGTGLGGFVRTGGEVNIGGPLGFVASFTGEHAWAGIALCALYRATGEPRYLDGAVRIATWLSTTCRGTGPLGGFTRGVDRTGTALADQRTAHHAGLVAFFSQLHQLSGDHHWDDEADYAIGFLQRMWDPTRQLLRLGSPDGRTVDATAVAVETQSLGYLALPGRRYRGCLAASAALLVTDSATEPNSALVAPATFTGTTVSSASTLANPTAPIEPPLPPRPDPHGVWFEGTAQFASALRASGDPAGSLLDTLVRAQATLGTGQSVAGRALPGGTGLVAASSPVHVGYVASGYYPARHVGATGWMLLALAGINPLDNPEARESQHTGG